MPNIKYFLYARKSTEDEERQIMSIEAQLAELAEFAKRDNIEIAETFIESKSAKQPGREVFNKMMAKVSESVEPMGLLAWHPDRLARNSIDGGQIIYSIDINKLAALRFPTFWFEPTPQGLFMPQVAFGQLKYYSDNLSENVKRGIRQKLRRGEYPHRAPFGYANNAKTRNIEPDGVKARLVAKAFEEFSTRQYTLESLGERLSFWGAVSSNGTPLCKATISKLLTNLIYTGVIKRNGECYEGNFAPIVSRAAFEAVQAILQDRAKPRKTRDGHNFPFTGLFKCGECRAAITAQYAKGNGGTYIYYRCTKRLGPCSQSYLRHDLLVSQLSARLAKVALNREIADKMLEQVKAWENEAQGKDKAFAQNFDSQIKATSQKLDKLVDAFLDNIVEKDIYLEKKAELIKIKTDLQQRKSGFGRTGNNWFEPARNFINTAHRAEKLAQSQDFQGMKILVEKIGTNRLLLGKQTQWEWEKPWNFLAENFGNSEWSGYSDSNRESPRPKRGALAN